MTSIFLAMFWVTVGTLTAPAPDTGQSLVIVSESSIAFDRGILVPAPPGALPDPRIYRTVAAAYARVVDLDEDASGTVVIPTP